ncbi:DUF805 domain-containing protein [Alteromonas oceanisediminis]|uniref:DUF805 domain-containing protein n=1 Tax=Alteromonas oceanisediminis TaxID=2836180 RepID=UPI001BDA1014|nr:DUF805 domain-containing protein [Alteromonas oceanisediminis]
MDLITALFSFKGRMRRSDFNKLWLPLTITPLIISYFSEDVAIVIIFFSLWPLFALTTKRYHDFGSSGILGLFQLLPLFGWLIVFVGCSLTIGDYKDNKYGTSPYCGNDV